MGDSPSRPAAAINHQCIECNEWSYECEKWGNDLFDYYLCRECSRNRIKKQLGIPQSPIQRKHKEEDIIKMKIEMENMKAKIQHLELKIKEIKSNSTMQQLEKMEEKIENNQLSVLELYNNVHDVKRQTNSIIALEKEKNQIKEVVKQLHVSKTVDKTRIKNLQIDVNDLKSKTSKIIKSLDLPF